LNLEEFSRDAGISFADPSLLQRALTHRSYVNENSEALEDNERLEFLGDSALDFIAASWLYNRFPEMDEGQLTRLRSALVRTEQLAVFADEIRLGDALLLGRGEEASGGRERPAILCAAFEALIGAMYLDAGLDRVASFVEPRFQHAVRGILKDELMVDSRSSLQMWAQARLGETPRYRTVEAYGPDHAKEFVVEVCVGETIVGRGVGRSKQEAAQHAAETVLQQVQNQASFSPK
jgi:ribonuclease-3